MWCLDILDQVTKYPTPMADTIANGYLPPDKTFQGWDGWMHLLKKPARAQPYFPTGLLPTVLAQLSAYQYCYEVIDRRVCPDEGYAGCAPVPLRDYQAQAAQAAVAAGRGVLDMPPRAGKTRCMTEIVRTLGLPTIWIAPTDRIVRQTVQAINDLLGEGYARQQTGGKLDEKALHAPVVCCTAATASRLSPDFFQTREIIVVDEWHHCLSGTTRVLTATGWRAICSIRVGDLVLGRGSRGLGWYPVRSVFEYPAPQTMYRTVLDNGMVLESTAAHEIYAVGGKVFADELRKGRAVQVLRVRPGIHTQRALGTAYAILPRARYRYPYLRQLWRAYSQSEFRGTSDQLFGAQQHGRPGNPQTGYGVSLEKRRVPPVFVRADAGGEEPSQARRRAFENLRRMARYGSRALRARRRGERQIRYGVGMSGSASAGSFGFRFRVQSLDGRAQRARGDLVFLRCGPPWEKGGCGDRRQQPRQSARRRRPQGRGAVEFRLGGISHPSGAHRGRASVAAAQVTHTEIVPPTGLSVYDIEVKDAHNYFAEGVLVSNSAAKSYKGIFAHCDHIYYRYGMTGTFFRSGGDEMAMHALLSTTVYRITPPELVERGYLVPTKVVMLPVTGQLRVPGGSRGFQEGHGKHGIHEHEMRNRWAAYAVQALLDIGKTVLVLVGTKKQGRLLRDLVQERIPPAPDGAQFAAVEFVSTDTPRPVLGQILESFLTHQEVRVLIGTSLLGEGVDLPTADALVYAKGEKAEVTLVQNAYRVGTAIEGKREAVIVDFADRHNKKLLAHAQERGRVYHEQQTFQVEVLDDPCKFEGWLRVLQGEDD